MLPTKFVLDQVILPAVVNLATTALYDRTSAAKSDQVVNRIEIAYKSSDRQSSICIRAQGRVQDARVVGQGRVIAAEVKFFDLPPVRFAVGRDKHVGETRPSTQARPLVGNRTRIGPREVTYDRSYRALAPATDAAERRRGQPFLESGSTPGRMPFVSSRLPSPSRFCSRELKPVVVSSSMALQPACSELPISRQSTAVSVCSSKPGISLGEIHPYLKDRTPRPPVIVSGQIRPIAQDQERVAKPPACRASSANEDRGHKTESDLPVLDQGSKPLLEKLNHALKGVQDGGQAIAILDGLKRIVLKLDHYQRLRLVYHLAHYNPHLAWRVWLRALVIWDEYSNLRLVSQS